MGQGFCVGDMITTDRGSLRPDYGKNRSLSQHCNGTFYRRQRTSTLSRIRQSLGTAAFLHDRDGKLDLWSLLFAILTATARARGSGPPARWKVFRSCAGRADWPCGEKCLYSNLATPFETAPPSALDQTNGHYAFSVSTFELL